MHHFGNLPLRCLQNSTSLSCLTPPFMNEIMLLFRDTKQASSLSNLVECKVSTGQEKVLPLQHLLPDIAAMILKYILGIHTGNLKLP